MTIEEIIRIIFGVAMIIVAVGALAIGIYVYCSSDIEIINKKAGIPFPAFSL